MTTNDGNCRAESVPLQVCPGIARHARKACGKKFRSRMPRGIGGREYGHQVGQAIADISAPGGAHSQAAH